MARRAMSPLGCPYIFLFAYIVPATMDEDTKDSIIRIETTAS
jgi:hypothetical protein